MAKRSTSGGGGTIYAGGVKVNISADTSPYMKAMKDIERHTGNLVKQGGILHRAKSAFIGVGSAMVVFSTLGAISEVFNRMTQAAPKMSVVLEEADLQFKHLIGDAKEAKTFVRDLFKFAAETPFETEPLIQASRMLLQMGINSQDAVHYLRMVGDAAAVTAVPVEQMSRYFGRLFAAIRAGIPLGDELRRLFEVGGIRVEAFHKLREMSEARDIKPEALTIFLAEFERFKGATEEMASTWKGLTSTIADAWALVSAEGITPEFEKIKDWLKDIRNYVGGEEFRGTVIRTFEYFRISVELVVTPLEAIYSALKRIAELPVPKTIGWILSTGWENLNKLITTPILFAKAPVGWFEPMATPEAQQKLKDYRNALQHIEDGIPNIVTEMEYWNKIQMELLRRIKETGLSGPQSFDAMDKAAEKLQEKWTDLLKTIKEFRAESIWQKRIDAFVERGTIEALEELQDKAVALNAEIDAMQNKLETTKPISEEALKAMADNVKLNISQFKDLEGAIDRVKEAFDRAAEAHTQMSMQIEEEELARIKDIQAMGEEIREFFAQEDWAKQLLKKIDTESLEQLQDELGQARERLKDLQEMFSAGIGFEGMNEAFEAAKQKVEGLTGAVEEKIDRNKEAMEEMGRAIEAVFEEVGDAISDTLLSVIQGTRDTKEAFRDMAESILAKLLDLAIQAQIMDPLATWAKRVSGGGGFWGSLFSSVGGFFGAGKKVPGAQEGGIFTRPSITSIAEREPEIALPLSKLPRFAETLPGREGGRPIELTVINALNAEDLTAVGISRRPGVVLNVIGADYQRRGPTRRMMQPG